MISKEIYSDHIKDGSNFIEEGAWFIQNLFNDAQARKLYRLQPLLIHYFLVKFFQIVPAVLYLK